LATDSLADLTGMAQRDGSPVRPGAFRLRGRRPI